MATYDKLIKHLRDHPHTSDELTEKTGLTEIAGRLCEAKDAGYEINTTMIEDFSRGFKRHIARYALIHEPQGASHAS
ncbi:MAG: hypothetical protein JKY87_06635 [Mariprofundus sp.]|nr:hypothetical protein [Mariprofundus sp.]